MTHAATTTPIKSHQKRMAAKYDAIGDILITVKEVKKVYCDAAISVLLCLCSIIVSVLDNT